MTVTGPLEPNLQGAVLLHEHILVDARSRYNSSSEGTTAGQPPPPSSRLGSSLTLETLALARRNPGQVNGAALLDSVDDAVNELVAFRKSGGGGGSGLVLDCTLKAESRDPAGLRKVSLLSGVPILMGASATVLPSSSAEEDNAVATPTPGTAAAAAAAAAALVEGVCAELLHELRVGADVPALHSGSEGTLLAAAGSVRAGYILVQVRGPQKRLLGGESREGAALGGAVAETAPPTPCCALSGGDAALLLGAAKAQAATGAMIMVVLPFASPTQSSADIETDTLPLVVAITSTLQSGGANLTRVVISGADSLLCTPQPSPHTFRAPTTNAEGGACSSQGEDNKQLQQQQQQQQQQQAGKAATAAAELVAATLASGVSLVCSGFGLGLLLCPDPAGGPAVGPAGGPAGDPAGDRADGPAGGGGDHVQAANCWGLRVTYDAHGRPLPLHDDELAKGVATTVAAAAAAAGSPSPSASSNGGENRGSLFLGQATHLKLQLRKFGGFGYAHTAAPQGQVAKRLRHHLKTAFSHNQVGFPINGGGGGTDGARLEACSLACVSGRAALGKLGWWAPPVAKEVELLTSVCSWCQKRFVYRDDVHFSKFSFEYCKSKCLRSHRQAGFAANAKDAGTEIDA